MNRLIAIILLTIYTSTAFGVVINYHYCRGHLTNVSFLNFHKLEGCGCNPQNMEKGCCKDKIQYQKADNHRIKNVQAIPGPSAFKSVLFFNYCSRFAWHDIGAPNISSAYLTCYLRTASIPIFIVNKVFRI